MNKIQDDTRLLPSEQQDKFEKSGSLGVFFFSWVYPILKVGKSRNITQEDIHSLRQTDCAASSYLRFYTFFKNILQDNDQLKLSLYKAFKAQIYFSFLIFSIASLMALMQPEVTNIGQRYFIYDNPEDKPSFNSMMIFVVAQLSYLLIISLFKPYYMFQQTILSVKIQGALQQQILTKTLKFPISRSKNYSTGELINMLQVDVTQASNFFQNAYQLFVLPVQLFVAGLVFFITLREDAIVPASGAVLQSCLGLMFGYYYGKIQNKFMHEKDLRMKSVDEALIYAKQIKLNCLEEHFEEKIAKRRQRELKYLKYQIWMLIFIKFIQNIVGLLNWEIWFIIAKSLNFAKIGVMMQNYAMIVTLLENLPNQVKIYKMSVNSMERIACFLLQTEVEDNSAIEQLLKSQSSDLALKISKLSCDWKCNDQNAIQAQDQFSIQVDDIRIQKGKFIAVVGNSASGKSTILRSILRETYYNNGTMEINGTVSVATQEPWIISGSIKENIIFMQPYDSIRYNKVIKVCGLERDIANFKYGDNTILGEKGDNLSGGQQKRINLARAIYKDADIYLLDDPLSALDIKVRYHIHNKCFMEFMKGKTRIIFTNSMANLQEVDQIYIVDKGKIISQGTFSELRNISNKQSLLREERKEQIDLKFEEDHYEQNIDEQQDLKSSLIQLEDQQNGSIKKTVRNQILRFQGKYLIIILPIVYFGVVLFCQLYGNKLLAKDDITDDEFRTLAIYLYPLIMLPIILAQLTLSSYFLLKGLRTSLIVHRDVINSLLNASFTKFYNTILIGRLMNRLSKDIYNIDMLFPNEMFNFVFQATSLLLPLVASMFYLNISALPLIIVFFGILIYMTIIYYSCLRELTRIEAVSKSPVFTFYQQIVRGLIYARSCIESQKILVQHQQNVDVDLGNQISLNGLQYWYQSLAGTITNLFQAILFFICVIIHPKTQFIFPGNTQKMTYLIVLQMSSVSSILLNLAISYGNLLMYAVSFERCLHLANNIEREDDRKVSISSNVDPNSQEQSKLQLSMNNCSFQYRPNSKCVLHDLTFDLTQGEKIGIVGRTGAGKSSIIMALTQMLERTTGKLQIQGKPISQYSLRDLRSLFSIIPQDPLIFMGDLQENLDPLNRFEKSQLMEISEICQLFELDSFKKDKLKSQISVAGSNLSLGEKQLISIARCLLDKKTIILVDEATASIDGPTEEKIQAIFIKYLNEAAMLTIAHKVTTIMNSDKIMVLNDGKITEFDNPIKLLQNPNSEFKQIIDLIQDSEAL